MERRLAVFESRVVRNIFGPKRGEMEGDWRRLHKEELSDLCDLYSFSTHGGKVHTGFGWGDLRERENLEDLDVNVRTILKCIFKKWDVRAWTGLIWLRIRTGGRRL